MLRPPTHCFLHSSTFYAVNQRTVRNRMNIIQACCREQGEECVIVIHRNASGNNLIEKLVAIANVSVYSFLHRISTYLYPDEGTYGFGKSTATLQRLYIFPLFSPHICMTNSYLYDLYIYMTNLMVFSSIPYRESYLF